LDRRLGGPHSRSGRGGEKKNSQPPPGIEPWNSDRPAQLCNTYVYILRDKRRLRMFRNNVLRIIYEPKKHEGTGDWIKGCNEEFHKFVNFNSRKE
jgi:hypothetical protein